MSMVGFLSKVFCVVLLGSLIGCAFDIPDKNPITQINLKEFNKSVAFEEALYLPKFPNPVTANHVLYNSVSLGSVSGVPDVIRNINIAVASFGQFEEALRETLRQSNLLSKDKKKAKYILDARYIDSGEMDLKTVVQYQLREKGVARPLLDREFSNKVIVENWWGGMMWQHARLAKQFSLMINTASITWCLEQYSGASFPDDCNLIFVTPEHMKTMTFPPDEINVITTRK